MKKYHLLAPGPTPIPPEVLQAIGRPILHHRTPEFEALFGRVRAGLAELHRDAERGHGAGRVGHGRDGGGGRQSLLAGRRGARRPLRQVRRALARHRARVRRHRARHRRAVRRDGRAGARGGGAGAASRALARSSSPRARRRPACSRTSRPTPRSPGGPRPCAWWTPSRRSASCRARWTPGGSTPSSPARRRG